VAVNPRRALHALLVFGLAGSGAELLLLEHTENIWQWLPLWLITLTFVALVMQCVFPQPPFVRMFQATLFLLMAGGVIGLGLHFNGNREFELELHPALSGMKLIWASLKGATPALAPGMLILLGCLGLISTVHHPALPASAKTQTPGEK
jgi:hypothetical protein